VAQRRTPRRRAPAPEAQFSAAAPLPPSRDTGSAEEDRRRFLRYSIRQHRQATAADPQKPTAVFLVGSSRGGGLHALLWVQRMFPDHFRNFIFVNARTVDSQSFGGARTSRP